MQRVKGSLVKALGIAALTGIFAAGCTVPTYHKMIITKYDAQGKMIGKEVRESITQPSPNTAPMKVNITKRSELEK